MNRYESRAYAKKHITSRRNAATKYASTIDVKLLSMIQLSWFLLRFCSINMVLHDKLLTFQSSISHRTDRQQSHINADIEKYKATEYVWKSSTRILQNKNFIHAQSDTYQKCFVCISRIWPVCYVAANDQWPLLLTWFNFNSTMDK